MKQTARVWIKVWGAVAILSVATTVYAAISGNEPLIAVGAVALVISVLGVPLSARRAAVQRKLAADEGFLADWEYSPDEAEQLAGQARLGRRAIRRLPCRTCIGRNCLLVANRYHPLNDYSRLSAEHATFVPATSGMSVLRVRYSFYAGKYRVSRHNKTVDIPVPLGREEDARKLADTLGR